MGDIKTAEILFHDAWSSWETNGTLHVYFPIAWLGMVSHMKGDPEQAIKYIKEGLKTIQRMGYKNAEGWSLDHLGVLYSEKGDKKEAVMYLNKALIVREELGNITDITRTIFNTFLLNYESEDYNEATIQLEKLIDLKQELENPVITNRIQLAQAMILTKSRRLLEKGQAQQKLLELIEQSDIEVALLITALMYLFDLKIGEWKASENDETLREIHQILKKLDNIAESQNIYPLIIENSILHANVLLIEGKIEQALTILREASEKARIKNLNHLVEKTSQFEQKLLNQIKEWQTLLTTNASIAQKVDYSEIFD
jgi:tetratricopeptide (TPR) repeat protein